MGVIPAGDQSQWSRGRYLPRGGWQSGGTLGRDAGGSLGRRYGEWQRYVHKNLSDWNVILRSFMVKKRCGWVGESNPLLLEYHDREWGVPVHDDPKHFEFLVLEGAQAGLNWSIVLNKREGYRRAFSEFDPNKVARYTEKRVQKLLLDSGIIRNRQKIEFGRAQRGCVSRDSGGVRQF